MWCWRNIWLRVLAEGKLPGVATDFQRVERGARCTLYPLYASTSLSHRFQHRGNGKGRGFGKIRFLIKYHINIYWERENHFFYDSFPWSRVCQNYTRELFIRYILSFYKFKYVVVYFYFFLERVEAWVEIGQNAERRAIFGLGRLNMIESRHIIRYCCVVYWPHMYHQCGSIPSLMQSLERQNERTQSSGLDVTTYDETQIASGAVCSIMS